MALSPHSLQGVYLCVCVCMPRVLAAAVRPPLSEKGLGGYSCDRVLSMMHGSFSSSLSPPVAGAAAMATAACRKIEKRGSAC